jgi:hypothetical protein
VRPRAGLQILYALLTCNSGSPYLKMLSIRPVLVVLLIAGTSLASPLTIPENFTGLYLMPAAALNALCSYVLGNFSV